MPEKLGIKSKCYRNTGTYGSPTWVEITAFRDLVSNVEWDKVEAPSRAQRVKKMAKTVAGIGATGAVKVSDTDAGYIALWECLVGVTQNLDVLILNGDMATNGVRGFRYDALVTQGNEDQGIQNALYLDIALDPDADGVNPVKYAVVTTGAPVFTSIA
jgi:hypothetical protein